MAKVLVADNAAYAHKLPEIFAPLVVALVQEAGAAGYRHILAAATSNGKNILPRVAVALDDDQISEIISIESADTFKVPIYAGNAMSDRPELTAAKIVAPQFYVAVVISGAIQHLSN